MVAVFCVIGLQILVFRSRWGLRTRAVGEHPKAADTLGIDVIRLRYRNVILGGVFAGLAGAFLTLESQASFQLNMTAGRGFIALAAVIIGRWTPLGAFGAALLFSATTALEVAIGVNPPTGTLGPFLLSIPSQLFGALPYIVTIVVLAGFIGRSVAPAADGQPYAKEART
jgi:simple sugar transport system permease protein